MLTRRTLLRTMGQGALAWIAAQLMPVSVCTGESGGALAAHAPRARYWVSVASAKGNCRVCHGGEERLGGVTHRHTPGLIRCLLCAQSCTILPSRTGRCRARMNVDGELRSLVYGRPVAIHTDPIEKKPFYHFLPGVSAFSLATVGCPLSCRFCQNWEISQASPDDHYVTYTPPSLIVRSAQAKHAPVITFTYNEPTVFFEYMVDIATEARKRKIRTTLVSCGFMNDAPLEELCRCLDAVKVDLKGFSESFYRDICRAELKPVLRTIQGIARRNIHLEIVNLVVPTLNDSDNMIKGLIDWMYNEVGPDVPLHFSRFHPDYQLLNLPPTPVATLERARQMALERGLRYVYVGNVPGHPGNSTYCPACGKMLVLRAGFFIRENNIRDGRCRFCRRAIAGVWM